MGVIIAAAIIWQTHSPARFYADPAVSLFISLIIFASAVPLSAYPPGVVVLCPLIDILTFSLEIGPDPS